MSDTANYNWPKPRTPGASQIVEIQRVATALDQADAKAKEISDALAALNAAYDAHTHAFGDLTGKPSTVSGFGITDAYTKTEIDTKIASDIDAAINALINGSPGALDTLQELATAMGNDPNFATTVTNSLAGKLTKALNLADIVDQAAARANLGLGSAATENAGAFASAGQGGKADSAVQPGDLGSAAGYSASAFATAAQGIKADNAQPALGYTPANKAGDSFTGDVYFGSAGGGGSVRTNYRNSTGILVAEVGVGVGSGYGDSLGFYNHTGTGGWWFGGDMTVTGVLSKGSGTFLIDHPLDPANRDLAHGFVEAPRYDLIYRGTAALVDGRATVDIDAASNMSPGTFEALTTNAVVVSLQNQSGFARLRPGAITGAGFEIICEDNTSSDIVSWVLIAERNDAFVKHLDDNCDANGRFIPEREKPE